MVTYAYAVVDCGEKQRCALLEAPCQHQRDKSWAPYQGTPPK